MGNESVTITTSKIDEAQVLNAMAILGKAIKEEPVSFFKVSSQENFAKKIAAEVPVERVAQMNSFRGIEIRVDEGLPDNVVEVHGRNGQFIKVLAV